MLSKENGFGLNEVSSPGTNFVLDSLGSARKRIASMKNNSKLRDIDEIWETYCDIEQSIEVSKFAFKLHNRLGKHRRLAASSKNDPSTLTVDELTSLYADIDSLIVSAENAVREGRGEDAIDLSRSARDQLKMLLMGQAKSEQTRMRNKKETLKI